MDHQSDSHITRLNLQMIVQDATQRVGNLSELMSKTTSLSYTQWPEKMAHYGIVAGSGSSGR